MDGRYHVPASRMTIVAHLSGITALILLIAWLLHYRGGLDYESNNPDRVFNVKQSLTICLISSCYNFKENHEINLDLFWQVHPFLMFFGLIFIVGEGIYFSFLNVFYLGKKNHRFN